MNIIVKEVFESYGKGVEFTRQKIKIKLKEDGVPEEMIARLLEMISNTDPFLQAKEQLEKESRRTKFVKDSFPNVEPETVFLSPENSSIKETYQYVPIGAALKNLMEDETYIAQMINDPYHHDPNLIQDVRDGECFRKNPFFQNNPEAVPLILFQDELEICNPIGPGKTRHKLNCTYFTSMHIQPALRSKVQGVQLVSLVKSKLWKKYGNKNCNQRLVDDLKLLENEGIEILKPVKRIVKAGLQFIVGDNLGQHTLAEMNQVFSSGRICRWCVTTYDEVCKQGLCYKNCREGFEPNEWTVDKYNELAEKATEEGRSAETLGVSGHCVFNQLESFHCIKQMPPCIGHDFFEGCFSYDVQFLLDFVITKEKLITEEQFNDNVKNVQLSSRDCKNRPREFKKRKVGAKFEGNSGSLRVLSRILPFLLGEVLDESQVGDLILKLQEIAELITAPKLTIHEIETVMHFAILEYLDMRHDAIENFGMRQHRPKHHFLSHYSELYKYHGPLIHLWAMRMEAKHQYFKNCIRTSKNFINPTKTCAVRHQKAQITYSYNGLFPRKYVIPSDAVSVSDMSQVSNDPFLQMFISRISKGSVIPKNITVFGTKYEAGMILVLEKSNYGEIKAGLLRAISFCKERVFFASSVFQAFQSKHGYYKL